MWKLIFAGITLAIGLCLTVQRIRCSIAVKESINRLAGYEAKTIRLGYGDITYVDKGAGDVILSVHGIFGGYDQAFDTCKDFASRYRILAPSRNSMMDGSCFFRPP